MFGWRKSLVYCSKGRDDWKMAKALLAEASIVMKALRVEEPPITGCGA